MTSAPPTAVAQSGGWPLTTCTSRMTSPLSTAAQKSERHPGRLIRRSVLGLVTESSWRWSMPGNNVAERSMRRQPELACA